MRYFLLALLCLFLPHPANAAIAFDNASSSYTKSATTGTLSSFTVTDGATLFVCVVDFINTTFDRPSSVTYNGVAMTMATTSFDQGATFTTESLWYLNNATGTHNIVATFPHLAEFDINAVSLTGVATPPTTSASSSKRGTASTAFNYTVTPTVNNSWIIDCSNINGPSTTASPTGFSQTNRINFFHHPVGGSTWLSEVSTIAATTTTPYNTSYSWASSAVYNSIAMEVTAAATAATSLISSYAYWW